MRRVCARRGVPSGPAAVPRVLSGDGTAPPPASAHRGGAAARGVASISRCVSVWTKSFSFGLDSLAFEFPVSWILLFWGLGGAPSASRALCACAPCPETRQTHTLTQTVSHGRAALEHPTAHGRAAADASQSSKDVVTTAARAAARRSGRAEHASGSRAVPADHDPGAAHTDTHHRIVIPLAATWLLVGCPLSRCLRLRPASHDHPSGRSKLLIPSGSSMAIAVPSAPSDVLPGGGGAGESSMTGSSIAGD